MTWRQTAFRLAVLAATSLLLGCSQPGTSTSGAGTPPIVKTKNGVEMVSIPAGEFEMGSMNGDADEAPSHKVRLRAFLMDRYEVTQEQYDQLDLSHPSHFRAPTSPVEMVGWAHAAKFCNERSVAEGLQPCYNEDNGDCNFEANGYRLPTEAEWEYACRAGTTQNYSFGSDPRTLGDYAWFDDNAGKKTHPAGQKKPNPWGLYDLYGNVAEWCNDSYDKEYYRSSPVENPRGPGERPRYVLRGGAWNSKAKGLRSSARVGESPGFQDACFARDAIGFRCVRKAPDAAIPQENGKGETP
jgi:formylglycine-generating enzyme